MTGKASITHTLLNTRRMVGIFRIPRPDSVWANPALCCLISGFH